MTFSLKIKEERKMSAKTEKSEVCCKKELFVIFDENYFLGGTNKLRLNLTTTSTDPLRRHRNRADDGVIIILI